MTSLSPVPQSAAAGPTMTLPPFMQQAAQRGIFEGTQNLGQYNLTNIPAAGNIAGNLQNNPFAPGFQSGAGQAGTFGQNAATNLFGAGGAVLNRAFDPQQALYNQYLQLTQQQQQAQQAQAGLGTSPYGVGLENQGLQNFNIGWNAQQLQNELAGLQGAEGAFGAAFPLFMRSAMAPYAAYQGINQDAFSALSALQQYGQTGATIPQQQISDWAQLLGLQPALAAAQNQTAETQSALQQTEVNQLGSGIAGGLNMLPGIGTAMSSILPGLSSAGASALGMGPFLVGL